MPRFFPEAPEDEQCVWVSESGLIAARFGGDGRVREKYFSAVHPVERPTLAGAVRCFFVR